MAIRSVIVLALAAGAVGAAPRASFGQSAAATVTILRENPPDLIFPGVGSSNLMFASGNFTQGSGSSLGSGSAGRGTLSAFAASGDFGGLPTGPRGGLARAQVSLSDSFTITADTDVPINLEFGLRASGTVSTVRTGGFSQGVGSARVEWNVNMSGGGQSLSAFGRVIELYQPVVEDGVPVQKLIRTEEGLSFSEFALIAKVGNGSIGQSFTLSMSALAQASYSKGPVGTTMSGTADFGTTLRWMGLRKATHLDGTPFTGTVQIVSASGFNYLNGDACRSDLNGDNQVDDADFVVFLVAYNLLDCSDPAMPSPCPADLTRDNLVDDSDFQVFIIAYNELLCP